MVVQKAYRGFVPQTPETGRRAGADLQAGGGIIAMEELRPGMGIALRRTRAAAGGAGIGMAP